MQKETLERIPSQKTNSNFTDIKGKKVTSTGQRKYIRKNPISKQSKIKIIKNIQDVKFKLKRGKDTPSIHIRTLDKYMEEFKHLYKTIDGEDYFQRAQSKVKNLLNEKNEKNKKMPLNTSSLWHLFGGQVPAPDSSKQIKDQFIINRMNARVLESIYQKYLLNIVFGSPKIQDKLTTLMFIQEYRTRLPNPLLCGKIECPRPKLPQTKYPNRPKSETDLLKISQKSIPIQK